jgi:hypothetical protein
MKTNSFLAARERGWQTAWMLPFGFVLFAGLYFTARFGGRWAETDSVTFANAIRAMVASGQLIPSDGIVYPNGYAFQAISAYVLALTGISVATLQQMIYPLMAALVVLPAWALYRELSASVRAATLATVLLFTQPEFLFVVLRSSHEKFTRTFMFVCLLLLVRSFKLRDRPWAFAAHVGLFYVAASALIASNNLLAHSFIFALTLAMALGWLLERFIAPHTRAAQGTALQRLLLATITSLGLVYLFVFYFYTPAQHDLVVMHDSWERVKALILASQPGSDTEASTFNAYAYVSFGWVSLPVYFLVSSANWIILLSSFAIWARQGWQWLVRKQAPETRARWLLWLLYTAFAIQGAMAVLADYSGAIGNLQVRLYPSFAVVAVAMVGNALTRWQPRRFGTALRLAASALIFCIAFLSIFKASNEPLLSNKWTFYRANEITALDWAVTHLDNADIGTEYDERLSVGYKMAFGLAPNNNNIRFFELENQRNLLITAVSRLRSARLGAPLPTPPDALQVYDNGEAQFYHVRPQTPYQK